MKKLFAVFLFSSVVGLGASRLPTPAPILTDDELRAAAAEAPVVRVDLFVPDEERAAEDALAKRFFNRPEEHRYSGMTSADWTVKWQLFSDALIEKSANLGFDSTSLQACLRALNRGRNRQTMLWPKPPDEGLLVGPKTTAAEIDAQKRDQEKQRQDYEVALRRREMHSELWYDDSLGIVPVGAYLAKHSKGECWIIVCKWETVFREDAAPLGHVMVWALDTKTASVVAYVTCD
jgi:hypothetical protein